MIEIGGDPTDAGPLLPAHYTEPLGIFLAQSYVRRIGAQIDMKLLRDLPPATTPGEAP